MEVAHRRLLAEVGAAGDLAGAQAAHDRFLAHVTAASFLGHRNLAAALMALFSMSRRLCIRLKVGFGRAAACTFLVDTEGMQQPTETALEFAAVVCHDLCRPCPADRGG